MNDRQSQLPFTLRQLQYAVAIEETGRFSSAAEKCRVSQPSLSAQVAQLESALGVQLFERDRRGAVVTPEGKDLLTLAHAVLRASENLLHAAERGQDPWKRTWRFGIIPTLAPFILPTLAPVLTQRHPQLKVVWREATTPQLVEDLKVGRLEAAVLALEADLGSLATQPLHQDAFCLVVPRGHPLADATRSVSIDDLDDERLLLLEDGHCLRSQALEVCGRSTDDEEDFAATSLTTLVEMVAVGLGVTLLPAVATGAAKRDLRVVLRPLEPPRPYRTIGLCWRPGAMQREQLEQVATLFTGSLESAR